MSQKQTKESRRISMPRVAALLLALGLLAAGVIGGVASTRHVYSPPDDLVCISRDDANALLHLLPDNLVKRSAGGLIYPEYKEHVREMLLWADMDVLAGDLDWSWGTLETYECIADDVLAGWMQAARQRRGHSIAEAAAALDILPETLDAWENADPQPVPDMILIRRKAYDRYVQD